MSSLAKPSVKEILADPSKYYELGLISIAGWTFSFRDQSKGTLGFLTLTDGSTIKNLQVVLKPTELDSDEKCQAMKADWNYISRGVGVEIVGKLIKSLGTGQVCELVAETIKVYPHRKYFPVSKPNLPLEFLREHPHLRHRTPLGLSVFKIRHHAQMSLHRFFHSLGFYHVATPILTSNDCEGAGETFIVKTSKELSDTSSGDPDAKKGFFGEEAFLTVSGQLHGEALAMGLKKIYTFGPTFRAEESNTSRHLAEFWMLEPEVAFIKYEELRQLAVDMFQTGLKDLLRECRDELEFCEDIHAPGLIAKLEQVSTSQVPHITYTEAIEILKKALAEHKAFVIKSGMNEKEIKKRSSKAWPFGQEIVWGIDMGSREERYLCEEHFKSPVIIYDYPASFKSFYMKSNKDEKDTVQAFDFLVPGVGELMGGSMREDHLESLIARSTQKGVKMESLQWYFDLREHSSVPHGGYGLGFERFLLYATGLSNIRDVIPFPRTPGSIKM
uniref:asparagine--tRNA ligase n=1 Tax=viral metagenome TaxID=1070528 RepID=A0A6C0E6K4_9ZZZZ